MKEDKTKVSLLDRWKSKEKREKLPNTVNIAPVDAKVPLSYGQKRLWFLQHMYPKNVFYNLSESYTFEGILNIKNLKECLNAFVDKHQVLKSYYPTEDGTPIFKINNKITPNFTVEDFTNYNIKERQSRLKSYMDKQANFNFNLSSSPLFKGSIIKVEETKHILLLTFHHIITDQWSMAILKNEIANNYKQLSEGIPINSKANLISFKDYAYWQNKHQTFEKQIAYWKQKLSGNIPVLALPIDYKRPKTPSYKGENLVLKFDKETSHKILNTAKTLEVTPFILFLSAYYLLLNTFTNQDDIVIGTPIANRNSSQLENVFGLFIDTIVLRTSIDKSFTLQEFITNVKHVFAEALTHKDIPFDVIVKSLNIERSLSVNPLFQTMFVYSSKSQSPSFGEHLELINHSNYITKVSKFDITLFVTEAHGEISSHFEYATDLFEENTINRFQNYLKLTLEYIVENINNTINNITSLTPADKVLLDKNNTPKTNLLKKHSGIHHCIEAIATTYPDAIALSFENTSITYKTLNEKANSIAHELLKSTSKNNKIVALCVDRSLDMIIGMLGILKSGCAYLPVDPDYPTQRIEFMLKDAKVDTVVTQHTLNNLFEAFDANALVIDKIDYSKNNTQIGLPIVKETDLAYIIYTSGSTGQPKGVPITHKNIINSTGGRLNFYDKNPSAFLLMSSISFDSSKAGIFWTLCTGGNLVITKKRIEQDIIKIANTIAQYDISHTLMLPSLYHIILNNVESNKLKSLNTVVVAGEACTPSLCDTHFKILPKSSLYNEYGPTEASVWCIAHKIVPEDIDKKSVPIGKPVANAKIYILDTDNKEVPFGVVGEIYVGGQGLSNGYLNRPDLTKKAFIDNLPYPKERLYKTGDLGKYRNDGSIDFLGRVDQQIKIRGYRVELDDIENTLNKNILVKQSVVLVTHNEGKPKRLIAYIKPETEFDEQKLKHSLKNILPDYMVPSSFIRVDEIPLLPNGKVDKTALSKIEVVSKLNETQPVEKPKNDIEQKLLDIWKDILDIKLLSTTDNFFEVGGDSITSIQIIAKARKAGIAIAPNQLFEHQSIAELAMFVSLENNDLKKNYDIVIGEIPLSPIQKWFFETHKLVPNYWNQAFKIKDLPTTFNEKTLKDITTYIVKTHDALRLSFYKVQEKWKAKVLKPDSIDAFKVIDISRESSSNYNTIIETKLKTIQSNTSLEFGSLFKCIYFKTETIATDIIVLLAHHLVIDFVSWQIIINSYTDAIQHKKFSTPNAKTASIKTWNNHITDLANSKTILKEVNFWESQTSIKPVFLKEDQVNEPIQQKDVSVIKYNIENYITSNILNKANNTYSTKTDELLLTAIIEAISKHTKRKNITIALERHGRETQHTAIDLSNTVGWFTSFYPKRFNNDITTSIASKIIATKEDMRRIPNGGIGYGILRYLTSKLSTTYAPEIVFNFLGKQNTGDSSIEFISKNTIHPLTERQYPLEINALIKNGILEISWIYANTIIKEDVILSLIADFNETLKAIVTHCLDTKPKYTPSDFPEVNLKQEELDTIIKHQSNTNGIEDIFPVSTMQQSILFHHLTSKYDQGFLNVKCTIDGNLDIVVFEKAWHLVVKRHEVLRTSIHWKNLETPIQLIQTETTVNLEVLDWSSYTRLKQENELQVLKQSNREKGINFQQAPLSQMRLIKTKNTSHYFVWSCHHLLLDGWSTSIIIKDLFIVYENLLNNTTPKLPIVPNKKSYLNWLKKTDTEAAKDFWRASFKNFNNPFLFNKKQYDVDTIETNALKLSENITSMTNGLAKSYQVTPNTLFQGIWALILSKYSNRQDITFGNTVSGRSGNFPNINLISGMFANVLPFRTVLQKDSSIKNWLKHIQQNQLESRKYEQFSISEISEWLDYDKTSLLDNLFIFENYPWDDIEVGNIKVHSSESGITTTYPLTIIIKTDEEIGIYLKSDATLFSSEINNWILNRFEEVIVLLNTNFDSDIDNVLANITPIPKQIISTNNDTTDKIVKNTKIIAPKNKTELELLKIWESLLNKTAISTTDSFFKIGGKSLLAIKMFSLIEKKLKLKIPPITLLEHSTITSLSDYILNKEDTKAWKYVVPIRSSGNKAPLFCIHGGGGFVFFFNPIANGLDADRPVYAIQPSGISSNENTHDSIENMAKDYAKEIKDIQPEGPYNLLVYCFSSAVGIEISEELKKYGNSTNLIVIDSIIDQEDFTDPTRVKMRISGFFNRLTTNPLNAVKLMIGNNYDRFLKSIIIKLFATSHKKNLDKIKRNLVHIYKKYSWQKKHSGTTTLILTEKPDKNLNPTYINGWKSVTTNDIDLLYTEGQHHQLFDVPYAGKLAKQIEKAIKEN
ncbi:amino acid adenylation domain-containing protein [Hyunsoonleella sp. 2307UL5-6]|uniref:non-ribosomal peptide synthetase n=1 Tax=Hyunsoonleella sp. 2307UL5-6 TaxID=3384768 RepID=UPI0039BC9DFF